MCWLNRVAPSSGYAAFGRSLSREAFLQCTPLRILMYIYIYICKCIYTSFVHMLMSSTFTHAHVEHIYTHMSATVVRRFQRIPGIYLCETFLVRALLLPLRSHFRLKPSGARGGRAGEDGPPGSLVE